MYKNLLILFFIFSQLQSFKIKVEDPNDDPELKNAFKQFKKNKRRNYKSQSEERYRYNEFCKNKKIVDKNNNDPSKTYKLKLNDFADKSFEEFKLETLMNEKLIEVDDDEGTNDNGATDDGSRRILAESDETLPTYHDWRRKNGAVAPVRSQGSCGSCWAFSAVSCIENALWRSGNLLSLRLSEQELVDCSHDYGNGGCNGGWMNSAFKYVRDKGISTSFNYFYNKRDNTCKETRVKRSPRYSISGFRNIPKNVVDLQRAIYEGVVAVAFEVQSDFMFYSSGVYKPLDSNCGAEVNHGMTAVGYKFDGNVDTSYFIIRNSWGRGWGKNGYAHVAWGSGEGHCALAKFASIPVIN